MRPFSVSSPTLRYIAVGALHDNYIWLVVDDRNAIIVDPGDATPVNARLRKLGCQPQAILLTHHHPDHVSGVADLLREHNIPVYGPAREIIHSVTHPVKGGDKVCMIAPEVTLTVLDVPGHTSGHIAFFQQQNGAEPPHVFCGDTLFACGCGRLFEGTPQQMLASLDVLAALPEATYVHCAHEYTLSNIRFALQCDPENTALRTWQSVAQALRARNEPTVPTTIGQEKRINPFLRTDCAAIQQRLAAVLAVPVGDRLATFTAMRTWKDRRIAE